MPEIRPRGVFSHRFLKLPVAQLQPTRRANKAMTCTCRLFCVSMIDSVCVREHIPLGTLFKTLVCLFVCVSSSPQSATWVKTV